VCPTPTAIDNAQAYHQEGTRWCHSGRCEKATANARHNPYSLTLWVLVVAETNGEMKILSSAYQVGFGAGGCCLVFW